MLQRIKCSTSWDSTLDLEAQKENEHKGEQKQAEKLWKRNIQKDRLNPNDLNVPTSQYKSTQRDHNIRYQNMEQTQHLSGKGQNPQRIRLKQTGCQALIQQQYNTHIIGVKSASPRQHQIATTVTVIAAFTQTQSGQVVPGKITC